MDECQGDTSIIELDVAYVRTLTLFIWPTQLSLCQTSL